MTVIAQQWISVDGFASGSRDESEVFAAVPADDVAASERHNQALLADIDVVMLGRSPRSRSAAARRS